MGNRCAKAVVECTNLEVTGVAQGSTPLRGSEQEPKLWIERSLALRVYSSNSRFRQLLSPIY